MARLHTDKSIIRKCDGGCGVVLRASQVGAKFRRVQDIETDEIFWLCNTCILLKLKRREEDESGN